MARLPRQCPACSADLLVTRLSCPSCGTEVTGSYRTDPFARLAPYDLDFVVLFVRTKGNIKEMERELGISYWTIRTKLAEIVEQMGIGGAGAPSPDLSTQRQLILEQLNSGEIGVPEATARLEELKKLIGSSDKGVES